MKILTIEDETMMQKAIEFRLKKDGYEVVIAGNGREGIDKIKEEHFDLILTDIMMPFINGLEIVSFIRNEMKLKTPIIMLTTVGLEKTVLEAFELGADDFITKPFSPNELSIRVKKIVSRAY